MIRAIIFLLKIAVLCLLAVWIAAREGTVRFNWIDMQGNDIVVNAHLGLFLLVTLGAFLLAFLIFRTIGGITRLPTSWSRYQDHRRREKGFRALTLGLTAVAAGDTKIAGYQAHRAEKLLPDETALGLLLRAQAARLEGNEAEASQHFNTLLENKDAAFLGLRGLLQSALEQKNYGMALSLARQALILHPKQVWILRITYDLEIRQRDLDSALKTLYRLEKAKGIDKNKALSNRIAMLLYEADQHIIDKDEDSARKALEKAYSYKPAYTPTVTRLAEFYLRHGRTKKAANLIEKTWKACPHPDLMPLWGRAAPKSKSGSAAALYTWYERLLESNKPSSENQLALAEAAINCGLWGEARLHLKQAESTRNSKHLYLLYAQLEEKAGRSAKSMQDYLQMAATAPPDRCWVCSETGRVYDKWHAYAMPHGSFDTIVWDYPLDHEHSIALISQNADNQPAPVLEAPH
jgi:HemY protein